MRLYCQHWRRQSSRRARMVRRRQSRETLSPNLRLWQCILTARRRDASYAGELVAIARNPDLSWQLRRTAIFAAGKLPYEIALEKIIPVVFAERSPLTIDTSMNLSCHSVLTSILLAEADGMFSYFVAGAERFTAFGDLFDEIWQGECRRSAFLLARTQQSGCSLG